MTGAEYEAMFRDLGFRNVTYREKLRHPGLDCTLYFNRGRSGQVYFTGYRRDLARYTEDLWKQIPPQQKKDEDPLLITVVPLPGQELRAFERLLALRADLDESLDDEAEEVLQLRADIGPTQIARLTKARRGQGVFRDNLRQIEKRCRVTGVGDPAMLIASHIKPWRISSDEEKLDGYNGLLLAPHIDHLFDKGYISFEDDGSLLVTPALDPAILSAWGITAEQNVGRFHSRQKVYLAYHRAQVFHDRSLSSIPRS